jgi:hypothetical protein
VSALLTYQGQYCYWKNDTESPKYVAGKMELKITSVLASGRRRIQARCKDLVKVTVKYMRRGTVGRGERETFPFPHAGNRSKGSKRWSPTPSFILKS